VSAPLIPADVLWRELEEWFRDQKGVSHPGPEVTFDGLENRNETKHLPYGDGTLRADPLREALEAFDRPATVISESPDEESSQMIRAALSG
jgi:endonuclease IV